ncbi:uncharacterized protein LOC135218847 [Macrobrachium nipponense]|uniref:uncharacterized protein LOC135218847 n=1 Tax=Macrobrachium nipponense TaxID=159736 RepID=UPI0030C7F577
MATTTSKPHFIGFYIRDVISSCRIMVDTGVMQLVFPPTGEDLRHTPNATAVLVAANGNPIRSYGMKPLKISILGHTYVWTFIITDIKAPLLEVDFLAQDGFLVDVGRKRLLDTGTCCSLLLATGPSIPTVCSLVPHKYGSLLQEFPDVFKLELCQVAGTPAKHGIYHHITTMSPPTHTKFCQLSLSHLQDAKRAFTEIEQMGICKKASSLWASPLHIVKSQMISGGPKGTTIG